jgi:PAS domain-containing protein
VQCLRVWGSEHVLCQRESLVTSVTCDQPSHTADNYNTCVANCRSQKAAQPKRYWLPVTKLSTACIVPYPVEECRIYEAFRLGQGTHSDTEVLWRRDGTSFAAEYWSRPSTPWQNRNRNGCDFHRHHRAQASRASHSRVRERYRLLFERNLAGVVRTSLEGRTLECNPAAARMFGSD